LNGGRRTKACDSITFLLSPNLSARLVDGGVDRWPRGQENASDHAPTWIMLDL
jgi:exodeoxyribonuclease III